MLAAGFEEFVSIVDSGSVTGAAEALGVPRPTVSKRLARLEERLGVRLLHRTTRRMKLTEHGELLYERARRVVHAAREAESAVQRIDNVPRGLLRVQIPPRVPAGTFTQWLAEFLEEYPEVSLDVVGTDVHVDLVAEGFDVALRYGQIKDTSLVSRTLVVNSQIAVASKEYLDTHGTPETAADLADHNCIIGYTGSNIPNPRWPLLAGGWCHVGGKLMTNHGGLRLEAAKRHLGIAMVVDRNAQALVATGELLHVLPGILGREDRARLVYPDRGFLDPKVRAFIDFIVARLTARRAGGAQGQSTA
ncbi:MAG: LysR family transcriptional regulator [Deltaproteobacteria bacterium]|nr:LysR family transcriptional regulator [Deltaproteobacteria bacterium]